MVFLKYLNEHKFLSLAMVFLILLSSICAYISPYITGDIVDKGIQLRGVEYAVPPSIANDDFAKLKSLISSDEMQSVGDSYSFNGNNYYLNDKSTANLQKLNPILEGPLAYLQTCKDDPTNIQSYDTFISNNSQSNIHRKAITYVINSNEENGVDQVSICLPFLLRQGLLMIGVLLVSIIIEILISICSTFIALKIGKEKRSKLYSAILHLSSRQIDEIGRESLVVRCTTDITVIQSMCLTVLTSFVSVPLTAAVGIFFAIKTAPSLTWIIVLGVVLVMIAAAIVYVWCKPKFRILQVLIDNVAAKFRRLLNGANVYRAFNKQSYEAGLFDTANTELFNRNMFIRRLISVINPLLTLGYSCLTLLIVGFGSFQAQSGLIQTGQIMAFSSYASMIVGSFVSVGMLIGSLPSTTVCAERLEQVLNFKKVTNNTIRQFEAPEIVNSISFNKVSFTYPRSLKTAVNNINCNIKNGEHVAIVGTTGSGKSTFIKLLLGLYKPNEGTINLNGEDYACFAPKDIRKNISYSGQNSFMFGSTIKDNVNYSRNNPLNDNDLNQILEVACINDFVDKLENKANTKLTQGCTNVSGGQKQRLSIARALAKDASIYIFDDCSSALDYVTECKVFNNINKRLSKNTVIYVTPKINIAKLADKILVMDEGDLVGVGTHSELSKNCSEYIELCKSQES